MKCIHQRCLTGLTKAGVLFAWLLLAVASPAENFTTSVYQPYTQPPLTWNDAIWQPGPAVPTAGNTYEVLDGGLIRNPPATGVQTFPGDSLTLDSGAAIRAKGPSGTALNFPGVNGNPGLILNGGTVIAGDDQTFTIVGRVSVASDSVIDHSSSVRSFTITAQLGGQGSLTLINGGDSKPLDIQSEHNPYSGDWLIQKGYLKGTGDGSLGTGSITISNGAILEVDYDLLSAGALTLLGNDSVMILHQDCEFSTVTMNGVSLTPGTYGYAQLAAEFPGNFAAGGSGSITVIPLIPSPDSTAPSTPNDVIASACSDTGIVVQWNASTDAGGSGVKGYRVFRNGMLIGLATEPSYLDSGLTPDTQYCYIVDAFDYNWNRSSLSAQACETTQSGDLTQPSTPNGIIASAYSDTGIVLQWNASTDAGGSGVKGYRVFRNGMLIGLATEPSYVDSGLTPDSEYCYIVDAFDDSWNRSSLSAQACASTLPSPGAAPVAPSNLRASVVAATTVTLNWQDNSNNELGFHVERALSADGPWILAGAMGANTTSYTDVGLAPSTTYYYRVSAFN